MSIAIRVEDVSKRYRLGVINRQMLYQDLQSCWARWRGKPDPNAPVLRTHHRGGEDLHEEFWALKDVSFDVRDGDSIGIIGGNGAGKSTLLKILSEITAPTSGRVLMKGRVASLLEVGTGFHPELTGRENVYLNGAILGMRRTEIAVKFDEIVDFSGIEQFIDTPVKRYSSGMRVRLAFAVAAHLDPEILIVDEVLAVGDTSFQTKCMGKLDSVAREGRTVIFVSHNMTAIARLCRRGVVLDAGRVVADGTQTAAIEKYLERNGGDPRDLSARRDRRGSGELLVHRLEFHDSAGRETSTLRSGEACQILLRYVKRSAQAFPELTASVSVKTELEAPVFSHHNRLSGDSLATLPERGALVCVIPRLPLAAGTYHLRFVIKEMGFGGEVLDGVEDAIPFTVVGGDFFGSGVQLSSADGPALVAAGWRVISTSEAAAVQI